MNIKDVVSSVIWIALLSWSVRAFFHGEIELGMAVFLAFYYKTQLMGLLD